MKKIAVFGKPGSGKSTFSEKLSHRLGINAYSLDLIEYQKDGQKVSREKYQSAHEKILNSESWIIDGLGPLYSFWERLDKADTLIYIDLPYTNSYWWVTKRLLLSLFTKPLGWPEGSSVLKGTINGWKYLRLSRKFWTPEMFRKIKERSQGKTIYRITKAADLDQFIEDLKI